MWWLVVVPAMTIITTVLNINFLGDGVRDALDPRLDQDQNRSGQAVRQPQPQVIAIDSVSDRNRIITQLTFPNMWG